MNFSCDFLKEVVKKHISEKQLIAVHFQSIGKWRREIQPVRIESFSAMSKLQKTCDRQNSPALESVPSSSERQELSLIPNIYYYLLFYIFFYISFLYIFNLIYIYIYIYIYIFINSFYHILYILKSYMLVH